MSEMESDSLLSLWISCTSTSFPYIALAGMRYTSTLSSHQARPRVREPRRRECAPEPATSRCPLARFPGTPPGAGCHIPLRPLHPAPPHIPYQSCWLSYNPPDTPRGLKPHGFSGEPSDVLLLPGLLLSA